MWVRFAAPSALASSVDGLGRYRGHLLPAIPMRGLLVKGFDTAHDRDRNTSMAHPGRRYLQHLWIEGTEGDAAYACSSSARIKPSEGRFSANGCDLVGSIDATP